MAQTAIACQACHQQSRVSVQRHGNIFGVHLLRSVPEERVRPEECDIAEQALLGADTSRQQGSRQEGRPAGRQVGFLFVNSCFCCGDEKLVWLVRLTLSKLRDHIGLLCALIELNIEHPSTHR